MEPLPHGEPLNTLDLSSNPIIQSTMFDCLYREELIDTGIETAVSNMQSVIDLGRLVRERNTLPLKVGHLCRYRMVYQLQNNKKIQILEGCVVLIVPVFITPVYAGQNFLTELPYCSLFTRLCPYHFTIFTILGISYASG